MPHRDRDVVFYRDLDRELYKQNHLWLCCFIAVFVLVGILLVFVITLSIHVGTDHDDHGESSQLTTGKNSRASLSPGSPPASFPCHFHLKENAVRVRHGLYRTGRSKDPRSGLQVDGYLSLTYVRPPIDQTSANTNATANADTCVAPFAQGARWKEAEDFVLDATNDQGLSEQFFLDMNWLAMREWDSRLTTNLFGSRDTTSVADGPDDLAPDGKNELQFGVIDESGVIAVAFVWGIFDGPVADRAIVEADVLYNLNFLWGNASSQSGVMDGWNIATHELGHYVGLGHVPNSDASMFASAAVGETKKRDLLPCEGNGLCAHYGEGDDCDESGGGGGGFPPRFTGDARSSRAASMSVLVLSVLCSAGTLLVFVVFL